MENAPAKLPVLETLSRRHGAFREVAAGAALAVVWAVLASWLALGVVAPLAASVSHLSPSDGGAAAQLAVRDAARG